MSNSPTTFAVRNGRFYTEAGVFEGSVHSYGGRIDWMGKDSGCPPSDRVVDAHGRWVLPGIIDAHCHLRDLGKSAFEDFSSGTETAAAGGVTTVFEMPTTIPPTSTPEAFASKLEVAKSKAIVDFCLYAGAGSANVQLISKLAKLGAVGFKTFTMIYPGREKEMEGVYMQDEGSFYACLDEIAKTGLFCSVHAENYSMIKFFEDKVKAAGGRDLLAYLKAKPGVVEGEAASRALYLGSVAGARMHIAHLSAMEIIDFLGNYRARGFDFTSETTLHYLTFTAEELERYGPYGKTAPAIRTAENRAALWRALNSGIISMVVSDHAPFSKDMKERGRDDVFLAQAGVTGLQAMVPVMLTHMNDGKISLDTLVRVMSSNPAKLGRIYPRKGTIALGADADFTVVDPKAEWRVKVDDFYTKDKAGAAIYDGYRARGKVAYTIVRGQVVAEDGRATADRPIGELVRPSIHPS